MKKLSLSAILCILSAMLILSCSSHTPAASNTNLALGDLTVDHCLFYTEGEDFKSKSGGDLDFKEGASRKKCLGVSWGGIPTDYVTYELNMDDAVESAVIVIKAATQNPGPQSYDIYIDDKLVKTATLSSTGGWGYIESEWKCFAFPLGPIAKGAHDLTIRPSKNSGFVNIDCIAVGKSS